MPPLGRAKNLMKSAKHKPKSKGKHLVGWWEATIIPSKARFNRMVRKEIEDELSS